jgi:hypothetical protein
MKGFFTVLVVLLPLAVMAAHADQTPSLVPDVQTQWGAKSPSGSPIHLTFPQAVFHRERASSFAVAHSAADSPGKAIDKAGGASGDLDLREVDWDKVKADKKAKNGNGKNGDNGDKNGDEEDEADEEDKKDGEDEEEKGAEGWDRLWDAPKLG